MRSKSKSSQTPPYHPFEFHIVDEEGFRHYAEVLRVNPVKV
ncbi:hypothetical protein [Thermococcus zilligii]